MLRCMVLVAAFSCFGSAHSATVTARDIPEMGCNLILEGVIQVGDAVVLRDQILLQDQAFGASSDLSGMPIQRGRLCFDSPGGSYLEGLRIADLLNQFRMGSAVPANTRCESACALAFMGGVFFHPEGEGTSGPDRVLHPRARLGFHAPALIVAEGGYTATAVESAYSMALQSLAALVHMRSRGYDFPESLLLTVLSTPPVRMHYIETVAQAARLGIIVAPVRNGNGDLQQVVWRACEASIGRMLDQEIQIVNHPPLIVLPVDDVNYRSIRTEGGYGIEAVGICEIDFSIGSTQAFEFLEIEGANIGSVRFGEFATPLHAYHTFAPETRIADLPTDVSASWSRFVNGLGRYWASFESCWLGSRSARVANVESFVNLRVQPNFAAAIIREIPLGERLTVPDFESIVPIGDERQRADCTNACRALGANANGELRAIADQCIRDNQLWYSVRDSRGNQGWVSRRYLEGAPR